jgi:hypothetical protein
MTGEEEVLKSRVESLRGEKCELQKAIVDLDGEIVILPWA